MQTNIIIHVSGPASTSVVFTPAVTTLRAPVAKGTVLGSIAILPADWTGNITVSGPDAAMLGIDAGLNVVAVADLAVARDYAATITVTE